ncbi:hypothetical protein [Neomoorella thermoacetica]|uniref:hypothetical protein n=1 Tax=Neomoorella thermoacetica TaxID=1525 RepID=UPI0011E6A9D4|nr:hypothetical protein [Moorella thermoacetica]
MVSKNYRKKWNDYIHNVSKEQLISDLQQAGFSVNETAIYSTYRARIWVEDGVIRCCSQMCSGCPRFNECQEVLLEIRPTTEDLSE